MYILQQLGLWFVSRIYIKVLRMSQLSHYRRSPPWHWKADELSAYTCVSNSQNLYEQGLLFCLDVLFAWEQLFSCYIVLTSYFLHQCSDSHALEIFEWYCESNYFSCVEMWDMCPSLLLLFLCVKRIGYLSCSIWEASCRFSSWNGKHCK